MNLLLDTHIWLRWLSPDQPLNPEVRALIEGAHQLAVSAISCWEVAYLDRKGRVKLPLPLSEWMTAATMRSGIEVISLSSKIAVLAATLSDIHRDPADRFIIATAMNHDLHIISFDARFKEYECLENHLIPEQ